MSRRSSFSVLVIANERLNAPSPAATAKAQSKMEPHSNGGLRVCQAICLGGCLGGVESFGIKGPIA